MDGVAAVKPTTAAAPEATMHYFNIFCLTVTEKPHKGRCRRYTWVMLFVLDPTAVEPPTRGQDYTCILSCGFNGMGRRLWTTTCNHKALFDMHCIRRICLGSGREEERESESERGSPIANREGN